MTENRDATTSHLSGKPVVVGVDGSAPSLAAVDLAGDEAARRGLPLEIVHAYAPPLLAGPISSPPDLPPVATTYEYTEPALRERADELLHEAAQRVRAAHPDLPMISRRQDGPPGEVLTAASHHAGLLLIGHRGHGGFAELLLGSVGVHLANHASCPVIIVRGTAVPDAPVVVGVDGSDGSRRAAEFAATAAGWYEAPLVALYAWPHEPGWPPEQAQAGYPPPQVPEEVNSIVNALAESHPSVPVRAEIREQQPAHEALVAASRNARLVVVGSRGRGGFRGLLLGSVSQALAHHAECPVAVIGPAPEA